QAPVSNPSTSVTVMPVPGVGSKIYGQWGIDPRLCAEKKNEHQQALEKEWQALSTDERNSELAKLYGEALIEDAVYDERRRIDAEVHSLFHTELADLEAFE